MGNPISKKGGLAFRLTLSLVSLLLLFSFAYPVKGEDRSIDELRDSVVRIICYGIDGGVYVGTGFSVGKGEPVRHIVTNYHVVQPNLEGVTVLLSKEDQIEAKVIAYDQIKDIAVLELSQDLYKRPPMEMGDSDAVKASDEVFALGFPADADLIDDTPSGEPDDVTITRGIISKISTQGGRGIFQVDVSINSGNSGGPLVNENGQVIGINTFKITSASGINGVVKIDELIPMLESRGIEYLTSDNDEKNSNQTNWFLWLLVLVVAILLVLVILLFVLVIVKKKGKKQNRAPVKNMVNQQYQERAVRPVLKGLSGYFAGNTIELGQDNLVIGRDPNQSQLVYPDTMDEISRKHCVIRFDELTHTFTVEDTSSNGTYLQSGERIPARKMTQLRSGDCFYLSTRENMFEVRLERF